MPPRFRLVVSGLALMLACTSSSNGEAPADDPSDDQADPAGAGGGPSGGRGGGAAGRGGSGGGNQSAGGAPVAGASGGAGAGGTVADAGVADASAGGAGGTGGTMTAASAGCGKGGRPAGGEVAVTDQYVLSFPAGYDGKTPMPVVFGFHGANRTHMDFRNGDAGTRGTPFEDRYVMAYVRSVGTNWTSDLQANLRRFDDVYDVLAKSYCIDTKRVFAIGHSSGAQFISNLVCRPEARLRAVAPVASSPVSGNCRAAPALLIHGKKDTARGSGDGAAHVMQFVTRNGCTTPAAPKAVPTCKSRQAGITVNPGCVEYPGCGANATVWCSHDDPFYSDTNHGWPCFANAQILEFFARF